MRLKTTEQTEAFGFYLGKKVKAYDVLALVGDLGTGKTTFVKALAKGMGLDSDVTSATFAIVNIYEGELPLYHFDVYRLKDEEEFFAMGGEDLLDSGAVCAVEWANVIEDSLPEEYLRLAFHRVDEETRDVTVVGVGLRGKELEEEVAAYENSRL
ncbi:MAG: tRNA (adenosine(37)-N6)-threonylcarbamoyltransferase complex ATPase subunit type 1 TsaE [Peptoniphilus sp.]|nr:tRNA (adenosine(37)-N6)-threonylcarbamoyltransferase complex ATPase subunit type 1 TsaE [Peptoniphilus sp.]MDY3118123.1 tRNA (adenosine(37)-N6)-threonylcarbamoyltransferase complex ATPase subunit type 1 TsaE [Peptoniphilus sp.]